MIKTEIISTNALKIVASFLLPGRAVTWRRCPWSVPSELA